MESIPGKRRVDSHLLLKDTIVVEPPIATMSQRFLDQKPGIVQLVTGSLISCPDGCIGQKRQCSQEDNEVMSHRQG